MSRYRPLLEATVRAVLISIVAVSALLFPIATTLADPSSTSSGVPPATHSRGAKPTIVLVHGAWADSSSWSGVITRLRHHGYNVLAAPNPLRSLSSDADYLRDFLATVPGPILLVGHSYGGAVITNAATGNPNVKALVYVDAYIPEDGDTVGGLTAAQPGSTLDPATSTTQPLSANPAASAPSTLFDIRPYPGAPAGDADVYLKPSVFIKSFAQDVPRPEAALLAATQRPLTLAAGNEPSGAPAWRTIPSWYLLGTRDRIITPASQLAMARRAHSCVTKIRASHVSLISHPRTTAAIILAAAQATR